MNTLIFCVHVYRVVILFLVKTENLGHAIVSVHLAMFQTTWQLGLSHVGRQRSILKT